MEYKNYSLIFLYVFLEIIHECVKLKMHFTFNNKNPKLIKIQN